MPGLRPPDHRSATTGARDLSGARESSPALGCCSGTVTQAIWSLVASPSPQLWATIMRPTARPFLPILSRDNEDSSAWVADLRRGIYFVSTQLTECLICPFLAAGGGGLLSVKIAHGRLLQLAHAAATESG